MLVLVGLFGADDAVFCSFLIFLSTQMFMWFWIFFPVVAEVYIQDLLSLWLSISCYGAAATPKRYVKVDSDHIKIISKKEHGHIMTLHYQSLIYKTGEMDLVISNIPSTS